MHYKMNIWNYFEQESKKKWAFGQACLAMLSVKDLNSSWNTLTIHLLASWNDHLLRFMLNNVHKKK